jgi:hypothetical protein
VDKTQLYSVGLPIGLSISLVAITAIVGIILNWKGDARLATTIDRLQDQTRVDLQNLEARMDKRFDKLEVALTKITDRLDVFDKLLSLHAVDIAALKRKAG